MNEVNGPKQRPRPPKDTVLLAEALVFVLEQTCEGLVKSQHMSPESWGVLRDEYLPILRRIAR